MFIHKRVLMNSVTYCIFRSLSKTHLPSLVTCRTGGRDQRALILGKLSSQASYNEAWLNDLKNETFEVGDIVNSTNFDGVFLETCIQNGFPQMCRAHFNRLLNEKKLNLGVIGKYFRFCYEFKGSCTGSEILLLEQMFAELSEHTLDPITCENIILGLSITSKWRECASLLNMFPDLSSAGVKPHSAVVKAFFDNREYEEGWNQMRLMVERGVKPNNVVFDAWLDSPVLDLKFKTDTMLTFMQKYQLRIPEGTSNKLLHLKAAALTKIKQSGKCSNCSSVLKPVILTDDEFLKLKQGFLERVLVGQDIFLKSKPHELQSFKAFLSTSGPTDVVLDGLNIGFAAGLKGSTVGAKLLRHVVHHFIKIGKKVMVLGREHMTNWSAKDMKYISSNCQVFLVDNLSHDDPLFLFAAMYKGKGTKFVSRDLMKSQKFRIPNDIQDIFLKWQQLNQIFLLYVEDDGTVHLKDWRKHSLYAEQAVNKGWHVPIDERCPPGVAVNVQAARLKWLCFS